MGFSEGLLLGLWVGDSVGVEVVGFPVGTEVGNLDGVPVGLTLVGANVGGSFRMMVGLDVSLLVGSEVVTWVGPSVGLLVGSSWHTHSAVLLALARTFSGHQLRALQESNASPPQFCSTSLTTFLHAFCTSLTVLTVLHAFFAALASHRS